MGLFNTVNYNIAKVLGFTQPRATNPLVSAVDTARSTLARTQSSLPKTYGGTPVLNAFRITPVSAYNPPPPPRQELPRTGDGLPRTGNGLPPISQNNNPIVNNNPVSQAQQQQGEVQNFYNQEAEELRRQQEEQNRLIEADYTAAMGFLSGQESGLRADAATAGQEAELAGSRLKTSLGEEATTRESGVQNILSTAETGAKSELQQARDLFRQTQQSNIAQLSALGISSSSVSEALAEKLGVETARRIAGVTGGLQEVRQNASKELATLKNYVSRRTSEIDQDLEIQKRNITSQLSSGLNQVNYQRGQSAIEKARGRAQVMSQAQSALSDLTKESIKWKQDIERWATEQSKKVYQSVGDLEKSMAKLVETANAAPGISNAGLIAVPEYSQDTYGRVSGKLVWKNKKDDEKNNNTGKNWWE